MLILTFLAACGTTVEQIEPDISLKETVQANDYIKVETEAGITKTAEKQIQEDIKEPVIKETISKKPIQDENLIKEFLKTVPDKYWYHDIDEQIGGIVVNNKRMDAWRFVGNHIEPGLYYWDYPKTKDIYIFYDEISTYKLHDVTDSKEEAPPVDEYKLAFVKQTMTKPYKYPKSPIDWMEEYKDITPIKVDRTRQAINVERRTFTSQLSLYFEDAAGIETKMMFDDIYNVPLIIEKRQNGKIIEQYRNYFDVSMYDIQNWKITAEITDDLANLPENHVILTMEEVEKLDDEKPSWMRKRVSMKTRVIEIMEDFQGKETTTLKASI